MGSFDNFKSAKRNALVKAASRYLIEVLAPAIEDEINFQQLVNSEILDREHSLKLSEDNLRNLKDFEAELKEELKGWG